MPASRTTSKSRSSPLSRTFVPTTHADLYQALLSCPAPTDVRRPSSFSNDSHVKRPRNGFIIFRSHIVARLKSIPSDSPAAALIERDNCKISCIVGDWWRELDGVGREPWFLLADAEKEEHLRLHPDYVFAPRISQPPQVGEKTERRGRKKMVRSEASFDGGIDRKPHLLPQLVPSSPPPGRVEPVLPIPERVAPGMPGPSFQRRDLSLPKPLEGTRKSNGRVPPSPAESTFSFASEPAPQFPDHVSECSAPSPSTSQAFDALSTPTSNYETLPHHDALFDPNAPFILTPSSIPSDVMHPLIGARLPFVLAQDQYVTRIPPQSEPRSLSHAMMAPELSPHWHHPQWKTPLLSNVLTPVSTSSAKGGPHHNLHRFPAQATASAPFTPSLPPPPEWQEYHYRAPARPSRPVPPHLTEASSSLVGWDRLPDPTPFAKDPPGVPFRRV